MILVWLICCICINVMSRNTQVKKWVEPRAIATGTISFQLTSDTGQFTVQFNDGYKLNTNNYQRARGINWFQIQNTQQSLKIQLKYKKSQQTYFEIIYTSASFNQYSKLIASYLFINKNILYSGLSVSAILWTFLSYSTNIISDNDFGAYDNNVFVNYICYLYSSKELLSSKNDFDLKLQIIRDYDGKAKMNFKFPAGRMINEIAICTLIISESELSSRFNFYVDKFMISGNSNDLGLITVPNHFKTDKFMLGFDGLKLNLFDSLSFQIEKDATVTVEQGSFQFIQITYSNFRNWGCPPKTVPYYVTNTTSDCVDICDNGYYGDNITWNCQKCHYSCQICKDTSNKCIYCDSSSKRTLKNDNCVCNQGFFDNGEDIMCVACISNCSVCTNSTGCQICLSNTFSISLFEEQIAIGFTRDSEDQCFICSQKMTNCLQCSDNNICTKCYRSNDVWKVKQDQTGCQCNSNNNLQLSQQTNDCVCIGNKYIVASSDSNFKCSLCYGIILGCTECQNTDVCTSCNKNLFFIMSNHKCFCKDGYYLNSQNQCVICDTSCLTCVDSADHCLSCNTTAMRVFNQQQSTCDCVQHFSDCKQIDNQDCQKHTCTFLDPLTITLHSIMKDPSQNNLTFQLSLDPSLEGFKNWNFTQILNLKLPQTTAITFSFQNQILTAHVNYQENLQDINTALMLFDKTITPWYFQLAPQFKLQYNIAPANNLASNFYSPEIYQQKEILSVLVISVTAVGLIVYGIAMFSAKIIANEMIGVMQTAYFGLFLVNHGDPLVYSLNYFQFANGFNYLFSTSQQKQPNRLHYAGYSPQVLSNLNFMVLVLLIPPIIALVFYQIYLRSVKYRLIMGKLWKLALGEWFLTAFLFVLLNYSASFSSFCLYTNQFNLSFYTSIIELLVLTSIFGIILWIFFTKDNVWMGEYQINFNLNPFPKFYYIIPTLQRLIIGISLVVANTSFVGAAIPIAVLIATTILIAVKKPFVITFQNYRSIIMNLFSILILVFYMLLNMNGPSKGQSSLTYYPWIIFTIVTVNVLMGLAFTIMFWIKKVKDTKQIELQKIAEDKLYDEINKKIQEMLQDSKSVNINHKLLAGSQRGKQKVEDYASNTEKHDYKSVRATVSQLNNGNRDKISQLRRASEDTTLTFGETV